MSVPFRAAFVLMTLNEYAYGDHVRDDQAFPKRLRKALEEILLKRMREVWR